MMYHLHDFKFSRFRTSRNDNRGISHSVFSIPRFLDSRLKHAGMTTRSLQFTTCIYFQFKINKKSRIFNKIVENAAEIVRGSA